MSPVRRTLASYDPLSKSWGRMYILTNSKKYVCNDNEYDIWVYYSTMAAYAQYIIDYNDTTQTPCSVCPKSHHGPVFLFIPLPMLPKQPWNPRHATARGFFDPGPHRRPNQILPDQMLTIHVLGK